MSTKSMYAALGAGLLAVTTVPGQAAPTILGGSPLQGRSVLSSVQYNLASCLVSDPHIAYLVTTTPSFQLPLILDQPTGSFGSISWMAYDMTGSMGSVGFSGGQTTGSYPLTFAAGTSTEFFPGWLGRKGLTYLVLPNNLQVGQIFEVIPALVEQIPGRAGIPCDFDWLCAAEYFFTGTGYCGLGRGGAWPTTLRRYRDEVLASSAAGQYYIGLNGEYSLDVVHAWISQPCFLARMMAARDPWITALQALVDGGGDGVVVTQDMADDLNGICDAFENTRGGLGAVVAAERQKLHLDSIAGLTLTQFQTQIETLGGPSAVEQQSWGRLKTLYR